eukprot:CAMPEP_0113903886 /NCGR_PEP_ID=MMETSP0780_2-20120614/22860_1 /TAXON_ID=652834 /ORGANISM="Palpitomonas bilix" /LENGTH=41 /DNA_ID=CAMNT_0000897263 /DNA_START=286 /DNA_END=408 /DNA_ORIENTATION=+ /assembly_acc=CAM_ASM_000599
MAEDPPLYCSTASFISRTWLDMKPAGGAGLRFGRVPDPARL